MTSLRMSAALACLLALAPAGAEAQGQVSVARMLEFRPTFPGVEYETPAGKAAVEACKVEPVLGAQKQTVGYALRDGQGKILRRFIDTDGGKLDQWSYYQDGFEVYRERDLDGDQSLDECRWLNSGGSRIAAMKGTQVVGWKRLSAEEASKMLVQALVTGDAALVATLVATEEELTGAGVPKEVIARVAASSKPLPEQVAALRKALVGWTAKTVWNRFDGTYPHVIPAEAGGGPSADLLLYENAMIFAGAAVGQPNPGKVSFLQVPEMIKLGETWKFVELPRPIDPEKPAVATPTGIRSALFDLAGGSVPVRDEEMENALKALADYDTANAKSQAAGDKKEVAQFHFGRIPLLRAVVKAAKDPDDQFGYNKQVVDSAIGAYQTGVWPKGRKFLDDIVAEGSRLSSYAAYRLIGAEFVLRNDEQGSNYLANQKKWMADLEGFLAKFGKSEEAAEVWLQLGSSNEFNADEDKAREDYAKLVESFPDTPAGRKAAGALRRLDLTGKELSLKGQNLRGETVDMASLRGKTVLVVFWASWGGQSVRRELPDLAKLQAKHRDQNLQILGISFDNDRAELDAFLKENPLDWVQIYEPGGVDSRLAVEYGIISLPTMFLVDAQGKVVNRGMRTAAEAERQLDKILAGAKKADVARGERE